MKSIDLNSDTPIALSEVPQHLPKRNGKKVHYSTVYRWATKGARGRILETQLVGGIRYTTISALHRFIATTTIQANGHQEAAALRTHLYGEQH